MHVCYATDPMPTRFASAIFLAGPTPRDATVASWRTEAMALLREAGHTGTVFVPEPADRQWRADYDDQVEWEAEALRRWDCILFWVPRDLERLPGFTTNDEWGTWKHSGRCVFGAPIGAPKTRYQRWYADTLGIPAATTLAGTIRLALAHVGDGAWREGAETEVPLHVWCTPSFQRWYAAQRAVGNTLRGARVEWVFRVGQPRRVFFWALHAAIHVAAEDRVKDNEVVLARPDITCTLLYRRVATPAETLVVLVREFRSPAATPSGTVLELPGGSTWAPDADPRQVAVTECAEETGIVIAPERLRAHGQRQVVATLSVHRATSFSAELTADDLAALRTRPPRRYGVTADTESTSVEVHTVDALRHLPDLDWATLGLITTALADVGIGM